MTRFQNMTDAQLVSAYAKQCGNAGWGSARATHLHQLKEAMLERFDCSDILNETGGFYLAAADVELKDGKVLRHEVA